MIHGLARGGHEVEVRRGIETEIAKGKEIGREIGGIGTEMCTDAEILPASLPDAGY